MKKLVVLGIGVLSYLSPLSLSGATNTATEQTLGWPVTFETLSSHVNATFPFPSRQAKQTNPANRFYMAQGLSEPNSAGHRLQESYTLVYQENSAISTSENSAKASEVADRFIASVKAHKGAQFKEIPIAHAPADSSLNQHYRALEVTEHGRTDYYVMRVLMTSEGVIVAVKTIQKDDKVPIDWTAPDLWAFLDSVNIKQE